MKEYIDVRSNFNNITREWEHRDEKGHDKYNIWTSIFWKDLGDEIDKISCRWSLGVHALNRNWYMTIDSIIEETIGAFRGGAVDNSILCDFEKFVKKTPNFRIKIGEDIQRELDILVKHGVVKVRDKK